MKRSRLIVAANEEFWEEESFMVSFRIGRSNIYLVRHEYGKYIVIGKYVCNEGMAWLLNYQKDMKYFTIQDDSVGGLRPNNLKVGPKPFVSAPVLLFLSVEGRYNTEVKISLQLSIQNCNYRKYKIIIRKWLGLK